MIKGSCISSYKIFKGCSIHCSWCFHLITAAFLLLLCPSYQVEDGSEEEDKLTQTEEESDEVSFGVIPLYVERATISSLESSGTRSAAPPVTGPPVPVILLLLSSSLSYG